MHGTPAAADAVRMNVSVGARGTTERRVDHEVDPAAADQLDDVVRALRRPWRRVRPGCRRAPARPPCRRSRAAGSRGRPAASRERRSRACRGWRRDTNTVPARRQARRPSATIAFASAMPAVGVDPHDLAGRLHLGPEHRVDAREPTERQHGRLHARVREGAGSDAGPPAARRRRAGPRVVRPVSTSVAIRASDTPITFETNGTVREARGFASSTQIRSSFTASWRFIRPTTPRRRASRTRDVLDRVELVVGQGRRRDLARRIAGVHARLLDVLHHRADEDAAVRVRHRVDVDLDRALEEPVDQHGVVRRGFGRRPDEPSPARRRRRRSPSRARRARRTGARRPGSRSARRSPAPPRIVRASPCGGAAISSSCEDARANFPRSSARSIAAGLRAEDRRTPPPRAFAASLSGVCPPNCDDHAHRPLRAADGQARPRPSAARSTAGSTCRSRSRRSRGCEFTITDSNPASSSANAACTQA